jgi:hypothetical protein
MVRLRAQAAKSETGQRWEWERPDHPSSLDILAGKVGGFWRLAHLLSPARILTVLSCSICLEPVLPEMQSRAEGCGGLEMDRFALVLVQ